MRIAIVRPSSSILSADSYNIQELGLGRVLADHAISCDVFLAGSGALLERRDVYEGAGGALLREVRLPVVGLPGQQGWFRALRGLLDAEPYDVVQTHEDSQITSARVAAWARSRGVPAVLCQGMYADYSGGLKHALQSAYDATVLPGLRRDCTVVSAKSEAAAAYCRRKGFADVRVNPVGLDPAPFDSSGSTDWRERLGISAEVPILLYVGVLEERRQPRLLVDIAEELRRRGRAAALVLVGRGPLRDEVVRDAESRIGGGFRYVESVAQGLLPSLYGGAAVTLLPSRYEIYGMVALESLYFGTPVLASAVGGLLDIVTPETGVLLETDTATAWADAVERLLGLSVPARKRMREAAGSRGGGLTWRALGPRYESFYRSIANGVA